VDC
jgi:hypothetical protein